MKTSRSTAVSYCLLMRFKNLGTDDAVKAHKDIIRKKGFVWAGWWAKPDESLPVEQMCLITDILKDEKQLVLYIADSNEHLIYPCIVTEVKFSSGKLLSPEPDYTPSYYSNTSVYIWFKIEEIKSVRSEDDCLSNHSFADYDLFPTESENDYSGFNNTSINTIKLVFNQKRTLMLLREKHDSDRTGIHWINTKRHFSSDFVSIKNSNSILVLSDLHFSEKEGVFSFADCEDKSLKVTTSLQEAIQSATNKERFASLICAGDFTHHASAKGFAKAEQSLMSILNNHSIDKDNVVFVPGNHDFSFTKKVAASGIKYAEEEAKGKYTSFYKKIIGIAPNEFCAMGRRILLKNKLPVEIVGLNSNCLQQETKHFSGMGYVGKEQLKFVETEMGWVDKETNERPESYAFRILVLHHHLYPIEWTLQPTRDYPYSTCLDAVQIMHFAARNRINLIIHGHKHQFEFVQMNRWTDQKSYKHNILGMGSTSSKDIATSKSNCIAILDFNQENQLMIRLLGLPTDGVQQQIELFRCSIPIFLNQ